MGEGRLELRRDALGVHEYLRLELASANVAVAHAGRSTIWDERRAAPSHERGVACRECLPTLPYSEANDGRVLAKRVGCGSVWPAPAACRIGGMGGGAERRTERILLHAHAANLFTVRGIQGPKSKIQNPMVRYYPVIIRPWADEQADAGYFAFSAASARLLALAAH